MSRPRRPLERRQTPFVVGKVHLGVFGDLREPRGVESMQWLLDIAFKDDLSRYRSGHGAKNMAILRRFALGLVRANNSKGSIKTRRKSAGWNRDFLLEILQIK